MKTFLQRNRLWSGQVQHFLLLFGANFGSFQANSSPPPSLRLSLVSLNRNFNDVVCIDHMHLGHVTIFHVMYFVSRISAAQDIHSFSLNESILALDTCWISKIWAPWSVHAYKAFQRDHFLDIQSEYVRSVSGGSFFVSHNSGRRSLAQRQASQAYCRHLRMVRSLSRASYVHQQPNPNGVIFKVYW